MNFCSRVWNENWLDGNREARKNLCRVFVSLEKVTERGKKLEWWQSYASLAGFGQRLGATLKACSTLPDGFKRPLWNFVFTWSSARLIALFQNQVSSWCDVPLDWHLWSDGKGIHTCEVVTLVRWWQGDSHLWDDDRGIHTCEVMTGGFTLVRWWRLWGVDEKGCSHW